MGREIEFKCFYHAPSIKYVVDWSEWKSLGKCQFSKVHQKYGAQFRRNSKRGFLFGRLFDARIQVQCTDRNDLYVVEWIYNFSNDFNLNFFFCKGTLGHSEFIDRQHGFVAPPSFVPHYVRRSISSPCSFWHIFTFLFVDVVIYRQNVIFKAMLQCSNHGLRLVHRAFYLSSDSRANCFFFILLTWRLCRHLKSSLEMYLWHG